VTPTCCSPAVMLLPPPRSTSQRSIGLLTGVALSAYHFATIVTLIDIYLIIWSNYGGMMLARRKHRVPSMVWICWYLASRSEWSVLVAHCMKLSVARPPMPWTVAAAVAAWLAAQKKAAMAIGVLLSFECYLRSGELLRLITTDFASGGDARLGLKDNQRMHIHLRRTKTGRHQGVEVRDQQVMQLVQWLLARTKHGQRVFNYHASTYRRWFHRACAALSLSPDYVPHSLRHGGATRDYLNGVPIADVMVRGRWAATKSATHYIQQGRQLMMLQSVPSYVDAIGQLATNHLYQTILFSIASQSTNVSTGTTHTS
jgi:Phage integrase family